MTSVENRPGGGEKRGTTGADVLTGRSLLNIRPSTWWKRAAKEGIPSWAGGQAMLVLVVVLSGLRFYRLRYFLDFIDESDNIVAGWLISEGESLYGSVFSHHMPLAYMAAHAVAALSPSDHLAHFRIVPWLAYVAVAASLVRRADGRTWLGAAIFLALVSVSLPPVWGHMLLADTLWGAAFAVFFIRFLSPFLLGQSVSRFDGAVGGAALATAFLGSLTAVYPIAAAGTAATATLAVSRERRESFRAIAGPFGVAFALVAASALAWMFRFGSLSGLVDQALAFNLVAFAPFNPGASTPRELVSATFWAWKVDLGLDPVIGAPKGIKFVLTLLSAATAMAAAGAVAFSWWRRPGRLRRVVTCLIVPALVLVLFEFLRMRGAGFHATCLYVVVFASIGLGLDWLWSRGSRTAFLAGTVAVLLPLLVVAAKDPTFRAGYPDANALTGVGDVASYIGERTSPSEPIAVFPAHPLIYLESRRKPAVGSLFYFPWQAAWERGDAPRPAACQMLHLHRPRYVFLAPVRIWDKWDWEDYAECLDRVVRRDYLQADPERFDGHLWERSPLGEVRWDRLRIVGGGRFGLSQIGAGGMPGKGRPDGNLTTVDRRATRLLRVDGWAEEDSGERCRGRVFVIFTGGNREIATPAVRVTNGPEPGLGGRWSGWSAVIYPQELRAGTYEVTVRVLRTGRQEFLSSPPLAKLVLE